MNIDDKELRALFVMEAGSYCEQLNPLFTTLEKEPTNTKAISEIFRIMHTLKANGAALGLKPIEELAHLLEDVFSLLKSGLVLLDSQVFDTLFRANDVLAHLIKAVQSGENVSYRGIKTKLEVLLRNFNEQKGTPAEQEQVQVAQQTEDNAEQNFDHVSLSDTVQVSVSKLDKLLSLVRQLIIEKDQLSARALSKQQKLAIFFEQLENSLPENLDLKKEFGQKNEFNLLSRLASDLHFQILSIRLVQCGILFQKFHRLVRDVSKAENKQCELALNGTHIEIDRAVLHAISESLVHLVRNAICHGIEDDNERLTAQKPISGQLTLSATIDKDAVLIKVSDDGKGIDPKKIKKIALEKGLITAVHAEQMTDKEIIELIFLPNFSTSSQITTYAGRGVGMDVVRNAVSSVGGNVQIKSTVGVGTTFEMYLPKSISVKKSIVFQAAKTQMAVPITQTEKVLRKSPKEFKDLGQQKVLIYRKKAVPIFCIDALFDAEKHTSAHIFECNARYLANLQDQKYPIILLRDGQNVLALLTTAVHSQKEIIEYPLAAPLKGIRFFVGSTIMGDGTVSLLIDVADFINFCLHN